MKRFICFLLCLVLLLYVYAAAEGETNGGGAFALEWMKSDSVREQENAVISPVSAYLALTMAAMGAEGETREELARLFGEDGEKWPDHAALLMKTLTDDAPNKVKIANSAWVRADAEPEKSYCAALKRMLSAQTFSAALSEESGMKAINDWVRKNTGGMIDQLLSQPLSVDTALALINTVYFNGAWSREFDEDFTQKGEFTLDDGEKTEADFMRRVDSYRYWALEDGAQAIWLAYKGGKKAFLAILPPEGVSADEYLNALSAETISNIMKGGATARVNLRMPNIDAECTFDMKKLLCDLGVTRAFDPARAQFGKMLEGNEAAWIGQILQKTRLKLDEKGTEASAATIIAVEATSIRIPEEPIELALDRSFLYIIYDVNVDMPLFMGKVTNP